MSWASRRKVLYGGAAAVLVVVFAAWVWYAFFSAAPTCFDHVQNGGETGVDCGGPCATLCAEDAHAPQELWSRALKTATSTYTAVAYIENLNPGAGAYRVPYAFRLFDSSNLLILERDGNIDIPPQQITPIIENNLNVGSRTVAHTFLEFSGAVTWQKIPPSALPKLSVQNITLAPDASRVSATIVNEGTVDARNLAVDAVLFDSTNTAQAASKSIIGLIPAGASQQVVFTWPSGFPNIVRAEVIPVPALPAQ